MSFDVSALAEYTDQNSTDLIHALYFEGTTQDYVTFQSGVKYKDALQLFDVTTYPQDDACGDTASGATTFTQAVIQVAGIKYSDELCPKDLEQKWTQKLLRRGSQAEMEGLSFEEDLAQDVLSSIQENNEVAMWQGDTTGSNTDPITDKYDGYLKLVDDAGTATAGNTSGATSITTGSSGNADTLVYNVVDARPAKLRRKSGFVLFVGTDTFDKFIDTVIQKGNYHIDKTGQEGYVTTIPGRNVTLVGVHGLDGTNRMLLAHSSNMFIGVDGENDHEQFQFWYSMDDDVVRYRVRFKMGVQIARIADTVQFTLA